MITAATQFGRSTVRVTRPNIHKTMKLGTHSTMRLSTHNTTRLATHSTMRHSATQFRRAMAHPNSIPTSASTPTPQTGTFNRDIFFVVD
jgi:hypothetical protein